MRGEGGGGRRGEGRGASVCRGGDMRGGQGATLLGESGGRYS